MNNVKKICHSLGVAALLMANASQAHAQDKPFQWPERYSVTIRTLDTSDDDGIFVDQYYRDGLKSRNENAKDGVTIFLLDKHKKITVQAGKMVELALPANWPESTIFPKDRSWELQGRDMLNGQEALKYKITRDPAKTDPAMQAAYVYVWITEDHTTPLRMEDGDRVVEFFDFRAGPQNLKLFTQP